MDGVKEFLAGTFSGMVGKIFEYPFDTVKVRLQDANNRYTGALDCLVRVGKEEGFVAGYYRGVSAPLVGSMAEAATLFSVYGRSKAFYRNNIAPSGSDANAELPLIVEVMCGGVTGAAVAHVLTPIELVKCRMQIQNTLPADQQKYRNALHCGVRSVREEGLSTLFKGHTATLAREIPGNMAWFGFYEAACKAQTPVGKTKKDLALYQYALAGGLGGVTYWTVFFPADVVKTRMQVSEEYAKLGLVRGLRRLYVTEGVRGLYSGWGITAARAFPSNAMIFSSYEVAAAALEMVM